MPEIDFKPLNLAQVYGNADASAASAMQMGMMSMQARKMRDEYAEENSLKELAYNSVETDAAGGKKMNMDKYLQGVMSINPVKGQQIVAQQQKAQADQQQLVTKDRETFLEMAKYFKTKLATVTDDAGLAAYRDEQMAAAGAFATPQFRDMIAKGIKTIPEKYDPEWHQATMRKIDDWTPKYELVDVGGQKLSIDMNPITNPKIRGTALDKTATVGEKETARHNDVMEKLTQAGQDLTDKRARETLALQGFEVKEAGDGTFVIIDKKNRSAEVVVDKDGKPLQGKTPQLTESQGKALGFGQRAVEAHNITLGLDEDLGKIVSMKQSAGTIPGMGGVLEAAINKAVPGGVQKYEQAKRDFITAVLRPESGATITPQEMETAGKQYFPQIGDGPAVLKQKKEAREREIGTLKAMAGPGAKQFPEIKRSGQEAGGKIGPAVGTVEDGYKFKGGDPSKAESWEKV